MGLLVRRRIAIIAALGVAATMAALTGGGAALAGAHSNTPSFTAIKNSVTPTSSAIIGGYGSALMSVEIALAPRNSAQLASQLRGMYTKGSSLYGHWLAKGQFDTRYAPTTTTRAAVARYLRSAGLTVARGASPFLLRATGSSRQIELAFRTTLSTYRNERGVRYFANSTPVRLPAGIVGSVLGVIGLTNTVRVHPMISRPVVRRAGASRASSGSGNASCETGYVTTAQLFETYVDGETVAYGNGAGPGCSGLTPSQTNSIYGAPNVGPQGEGQGVTAAVFELSAYQESDIDTWADQFYGPRYRPPLVNIDVDGGPSDPICPAGDECLPASDAYAEDIEVDADIEMTLTIAPDVSHMLVYNAPIDETGQTSLDEYVTMADQDAASTISSSWGNGCESDITAAYAQAENLVFEQMALQGQSMFNSAGDSGAFECLTETGSSFTGTYANASDPSDQPWVTGVGGTSLENDNPGTDPQPSYPADGTETVWNPRSLCNASAPGPANDDQGGFFWCYNAGAGGGAPSEYWGRPFYQTGPGVDNAYETYGNGTTQCTLARVGTPCREGPDISANADEWTGYTEYCTGNANTPGSYCGTFSASQPVPGWFAIGGTSLSSPLWAAIIADRDSYTGQRTGNANPLLYSLFNSDPGRYFHDITGIGPLQQLALTNGLFPSTPGYDMATGIGTPKMAALITGS
jgi:subtilase family serine protease